MNTEATLNKTKTDEESMMEKLKRLFAKENIVLKNVFIQRKESSDKRAYTGICTKVKARGKDFSYWLNIRKIDDPKQIASFLRQITASLLVIEGTEIVDVFQETAMNLMQKEG